MLAVSTHLFEVPLGLLVVAGRKLVLLARAIIGRTTS